MSLKFAKIVSLAAVAAAAGFSLWARAHLPDAPLATHFGPSGHANGYMPRDVALAFGPALALALTLVMLWVVPAIMPKKAPLERSAEAYGATMTVLVLFLCLVHGALVARAMHYPVDVRRMVLIGAGLLFVVTGNYLPKTRFNYVMGVRTPWTLSNEEVWDRTHRLSGPLFMILGLLVLADAVLIPFPEAQILTLAAVAIVALVCVGYSYLVAKRLNLA